MKKLISKYNKIKKRIKERLRDFKKLRKAGDKDLFSELCFCILTPQSKAVYCDEAVRILKNRNLLFENNMPAIKNILKSLTRFHNKKAAYLVAASNAFMNNKKFDIKSKLNPRNIFKTREWLVRNIKGLGYKEASHFLRNIGLGKDIAILDTHILKNLKSFGVIKKIPGSITKRNYIDIEGKMREFSKKINIPLEELDLLLWSNETGFVFK
ncbi:MAG: N-glycosylase/DNA lyase [Candidatus Omnitrophota bacterium]|nr:MAG: N-glycosylase/DNA lyase [Candidatus Omnitrophota bacterium]